MGEITITFDEPIVDGGSYKLTPSGEGQTVKGVLEEALPDDLGGGIPAGV